MSHSARFGKRHHVRGQYCHFRPKIRSNLGNLGLISDYKAAPLPKKGSEYTIVTQTHQSFQTISSKSRLCRSNVNMAMENAVDSGINHTTDDLISQ